MKRSHSDLIVIFFIVLWWWDNNVGSNTKFDNNNLDNDILQIPPLCQELCTGNVTDINFQVATCRCICNNIIVVFVATCWWQSWAKLGNIHICKMIIIHSFCVNYLGKGFSAVKNKVSLSSGAHFLYICLYLPNSDFQISNLHWIWKFTQWSGWANSSSIGRRHLNGIE